MRDDHRDQADSAAAATAADQGDELEEENIKMHNLLLNNTHMCVNIY